jgi:hypothetical protein
MTALRGARDLAYLVRTRLWSSDPRERASAGAALAARFADRMMPGYVLGEDGKRWFQDEEFLRGFDLVAPGGNRVSAERKYFLRSLLALTDGLPGDTAEAGVWRGSSSWFICDHFAGSGKTHHGFDSFDGLSEPTPADGPYWRTGDLGVGVDVARQVLEGFDVRLYEGWIPDRFEEVADREFCLVHVDVDLYEPTRDSVEFFYPRIVPGGLLVLDDYGFLTCPGARRGVDEFMASRPEPVIESPTGQAFVVKR